MRGTIFLLILAMFLVACSETNVVKIGEEPAAEETATQTENTETTETTTAPTTAGATVSTGGKTATACDDTDADDKSSVGLVTVTYSDGTVEKFYDACPGKELGNDMIVTEYVCDGNSARSRNYVCSKFESCVQVNVQADPGKKVGFCTG